MNVGWINHAVHIYEGSVKIETGFTDGEHHVTATAPHALFKSEEGGRLFREIIDLMHRLGKVPVDDWSNE